MAISTGRLCRIHFQDFFRGQAKGNIIGGVIGVVYFWIIQIVVFILIKKEQVDIPVMIPTLIAYGFLIPDFIFKLIREKDNTVMDNFLKSRPVSKDKWETFLYLNQFWKLSNLAIPISLLPLFFLFMPILHGLMVLSIVYFLSVLGGTLVMHIKQKGDYQPENNVKVYHAKSVKSAKGNFITGITLWSLIRSKRLRTTIIVLLFILFLNIPSMARVQNNAMIAICMVAINCILLARGLSVEANFFNGIWTRPIPFEELLNCKYRFGFISGAVVLLICVPVYFICKITVLDLIAISIFSTGFASLIFLFDCYNCVPFDLFGKTFNNQQGTHIKASSFPQMLLAFGIPSLCIGLLPGWKSQLILSALGIAGYCFHKKYFEWISGRFRKNRYKYMTKYTSL